MSCFREICKKGAVTPVVSSDAEIVFQKLATFIEEKVVVGCEVFRMSDLTGSIQKSRNVYLVKSIILVFQNYRDSKKRSKNALAQKLDSPVRSMAVIIYITTALKRDS